MDSVTQLALGAAIGEGVLGRKAGRRAALWGGICATLPDLDVLYPFAGPVEELTYHRSYTHSFFILSVAAPLIFRFILKIHPETERHWRGWLLLVFLSLLTHPVLDCLTLYGTQVFLPFSDYPVSIASIFIIDPFYTLPLAGGVCCAMLMSRSGGAGHFLNSAGLIASSLYLLCGLAVKLHVNSAVESTLTEKGISGSPYLTAPTPFNIALWRVVVMEEDGYREGFYSVADGSGTVRLRGFKNQSRLLRDLDGEPDLERLKWFSRGFYGARKVENRVIFSDLRVGMAGHFPFSFEIATIKNGKVKPVAPKSVQSEIPGGFRKRLKWLFRRTFDRNAEFPD